MKLTSVLLFFVMLPSAYAMKFSNQFIEFELPYNWSCAQGTAEWTCQSGDSSQRNDAIVVMAAKVKGDNDSMAKYEEHLKKAQSFKRPDGKAIVSQPKYTRVAEFGGQPWVDSMHMESEVSGFYTRYLATVKDDIGVVVTYSINKSKYALYISQFEEMVKTMRVFHKKGAAADLAIANAKASVLSKVRPPSDFIPLTIEDPRNEKPVQTAPKKAENKDNSDMSLFLVFMAAAVGGILYYRKKKSGG